MFRLVCGRAVHLRAVQRIQAALFASKKTHEPSAIAGSSSELNFTAPRPRQPAVEAPQEKPRSDPGDQPHQDKLDAEISRLSTKSLLPEALQLIATEADDPARAIRLYALLIFRYRGRDIEEMQMQVSKAMEARNLPADVRLWNALLATIERTDRSDLAHSILNAMEEAGCPPNVGAYNQATYSLCKAGRYEEAVKMVTIMRSSGVEPDSITYGTLVYDRCKREKPMEAAALLRKMREKRLFPSVAEYTAVLVALCKAELVQDALRLCGEMKEEGIPTSSAAVEAMRRVLKTVGRGIEKEQQLAWMLEEPEPEKSVNEQLIEHCKQYKDQVPELATLLEQLIAEEAEKKKQNASSKE